MNQVIVDQIALAAEVHAWPAALSNRIHAFAQRSQISVREAVLKLLEQGLQK